MSDHYGNMNYPGIQATSLFANEDNSNLYDSSTNITTSHFTNMTSHPTYMSSNTTSQSVAFDKSSTIDSIDRIDSGICSMTLSDVERHHRELEIIGEAPEKMCQTEIKSSVREDSICDSGVGETTTCSPYIPQKDGYSLLHQAIVYNNKEQAIDFIQDVPSAEMLDYFTPDIHTALHLGVILDHPEIVRFLVVYGANLNAKDTRGSTALHTACEMGKLDCARMLLCPLDGVEDLKVHSSFPQDVNEKNYEGLTPLHLATMNHHNALVHLLLQQKDIRVNVTDATYGRTALHYALERKNYQAFYLLLQKSANVNATTYDGCSPLHLSVGLGLEKETRTLMTRGANVNLKTADETKVWDLAKSENIRDALQYSSFQISQSVVKQR